MSTKTKRLAAGIAALVVLALGGALAGAGPGDDENSRA